MNIEFLNENELQITGENLRVTPVSSNRVIVSRVEPEPAPAPAPARKPSGAKRGRKPKTEQFPFGANATESTEQGSNNL